MDTDFVADRPFADYGDLFRWPFVTHKAAETIFGQPKLTQRTAVASPLFVG